MKWSVPDPIIETPVRGLSYVPLRLLSLPEFDIESEDCIGKGLG